MLHSQHLRTRSKGTVVTAAAITALAALASFQAGPSVAVGTSATV